MRRVGVHGAGFIPIVGMDVSPSSAAAPVGDWWDPNIEGLCVWAAYQPKGAANLAASYVDLSGNGNNTGPGVAPTWDAVNGWTFNGAAQYLTTAFIPQTDQSQSALVQYTNAVTVDGYLFGSSGGASRIYGIQPIYLGTSARYVNGQGGSTVPTHPAGNLAVTNLGYRDGVADTVPFGAWAGAGIAVYIGGRNVAGALNGPLQCKIQALVLYDCILTAPQVAAVAAAMAAL